jgi:hypothetical protein
MEGVMDSFDFLTELSKNGVAVVTSDEAFELGQRWEEIIRDWDGLYRNELALEAPALSLAAAEWAARRLYRGCQALVCREMPLPAVQQFLAESCTVPQSPSTIYSVDLLFRFLPDLVAFARRVNRNDPLIGELLALARDWPLSSVGIEGVQGVDPRGFLDDPSLRQLYVDRILATGDVTRLNCEEVRVAARTSLGGHPELAPTIFAALTPTA